jgi:hypothetical protein
LKRIETETVLHPAKKALATALFLVLMIAGGGLMVEVFLSYLAPQSSSFGASLLLVILMIFFFVAGSFIGIVVWMLLMKPFITNTQMKAWLLAPGSPEDRYAFAAPVMQKVLLRILRIVY